jgi:hypothetical protein
LTSRFLAVGEVPAREKKPVSLLKVRRTHSTSMTGELATGGS